MPRFSETPQALYPISLNDPHVNEVDLMVDGFMQGKVDVEAYSRLIQSYMEHQQYIRNPQYENRPAPWWHQLDASQPIRIQVRGNLSEVKPEHTFEERLTIHTRVAHETVEDLKQFLSRNRLLFAGIDQKSFDAATSFGSAEVVMTVAQAKRIESEPRFAHITAVEILPVPEKKNVTR